MYTFDPLADHIEHLGDLTEAAGESGRKTIVQGKCHTVPLECEGKVYLGTHCGYYGTVDGTERVGAPPPGYKPYPGGHLLAYDLATGVFEDLAIAPNREAILSMAMDTHRNCLYAFSWPSGCFLIYDISRASLQNLGPVQQNEHGTGCSYSTICRSLAMDPRDGSVYFTSASGAILRYRRERNAIEPVECEGMRRDYFGLYNPTEPGHLAYHWRQTCWHPTEQAIYGIHGNSGYLFRFDPQMPRLEVLERLTSEPSKRSGMYDQFSYGYLGFGLGPDGRTLHYLTGGPIYEEGKRVVGKDKTAKGESRGPENLHLITYDIPCGQYTDHGPIFFENGERPSYCNSIAIAQDGVIYTLSESGRTDERT